MPQNENRARFEMQGHKLDEVTNNCVLCGASWEAVLDNVVTVCVPDGKPHPRKTFEWDPQ